MTIDPFDVIVQSAGTVNVVPAGVARGGSSVTVSDVAGATS
jgi:hypothetical protein